MQISIIFSEVKEVKNVISFEQAQEQQKIFTLIKRYAELKETARYLAGNRKGAWGRTTQADEKRSAKLSNLKTKIKIAQSNYNLKYK